jgi:hypothetical protein
VEQSQYNTTLASAQAHSSRVGDVSEAPTWRLDKVWERWGVGDPVWVLTLGDRSVSVCTCDLFDDDWMWTAVFLLSHRSPPWRDQVEYRQWLQALLDECPL